MWSTWLTAELELALMFTGLVLLMSILFFTKPPGLPNALVKDIPVSLSLLEKTELSHNTCRFRFALPSKKHVLGLPIGQHMSLKCTTEDGKVISRSYTPVSSNDDIGIVDLVVKVYFKNIHPKFPNGGIMSQYLNDMEIGDSITVLGPKGKLTYAGCGELHLQRRVDGKAAVEIRRAKHIGMIAGGTGITPMLQIIREALKNPNDTTQFTLLFANQSEEDILLRDELDVLQHNHSNVDVWYTIDKADDPDSWNYSTGFITAEMIKEYLPAPSADTQMLLCGPPPMLKFAVLPAFESLGYTKEMQFTF